MRGINKVILIATVGKDPETRYTQGGAAIASFSCATNEEWKDKATGEKKSLTEWHSCTAFGKLAEIIGEYVKKGSQVYIEGRLRTEKWQDKSGADRYTTKIMVDSLQLLGGKPGEAKEHQEAPKESMGGGARGTNDFDDDIPFAPVRSFP